MTLLVGNLYFSQEGFELAKQYYERLILEFPYRMWRSGSLCALHFYPLMFNLWIARIESQYKLAAAPFERHNNGESGTSSEAKDISEEILMEHTDELDGIRRATLERATELAKRMDEVMQSFPQSDDATLWHLRGNVHLWMGDLSTPSNARGKSSDSGDSASWRVRLDSQDVETFDSLERQDPALHQRQEHIQRANLAFEKSKDCIKISLGFQSR